MVGFGDYNNPLALLPSEPTERVLALRNGLMSRATGGWMEEIVYRVLRQELLNDPNTSPLCPQFLKTCITPDDFWSFIKLECGTYEGRRQYLREAFEQLIVRLERPAHPSTDLITSTLHAYDEEGVSAAWKKALDRAHSDPEGAITAARTLLESVCKHILDEGGEPGTRYRQDDDLPKLYRLAAERIGIAPSQHTEQVFKQILGGCTSVVEGLGALRNRVGDAHGQGKRPVRPKQRHATLAVNLAGSMALFLIETASAGVEAPPAWGSWPS